MFDFNNHVKNLPDCYDKKEEIIINGKVTQKASNNFNILETERISVNEFKNDLYEIFSSQDIDNNVSSDPNIKNKTLDLYGERVGQLRGVATDNQYLRMIKSKVFRNLSNGTYPSVIHAICVTFGCDPTDVKILQKANDDGTQISCVVEVVKLPLQNVTESGLSLNQTIKILESLLPVCVTVEATYFEGTFEFAANEEEAKILAPTKGFNTSEETDVGGYFGLIYNKEDEPDLPI